MRLAAEADEARLGLEAGAKVLHGADGLLELREEAGHRLLVVPDVRAGAGAAADAFPGPEAAVLPPLAGAGGEDRDWHVQPVQQPVRQRRVVIRVVPEARLRVEAIEVVRDVSRGGAGVGEAVGVEAPAGVEVGEMPGDNEIDLPRLAGRD